QLTEVTDRLVDQTDPFGRVAQVRFQAEEPSAERFDSLSGFRIVAGAGNTGDVGAGLCQADRHRLTKSATGAGHQGDPAAEVELIQDHGVALRTKRYKNACAVVYLSRQLLPVGSCPLFV